MNKLDYEVAGFYSGEEVDSLLEFFASLRTLQKEDGVELTAPVSASEIDKLLDGDPTSTKLIYDYLKFEKMLEKSRYDGAEYPGYVFPLM